MKKIIYSLLTLLCFQIGYSQIEGYELYNRKIDSIIVTEGGSATLMAQKSLERNRDFNKEERRSNYVPEELKGFRLISTSVSEVEVNGMQSFKFLHKYYWFMKNKSTTYSHNVVVDFEGGRFQISRTEAISKLKEAKDLLDLGLITQAEYDALKEKLTPIIMGDNQ